MTQRVVRGRGARGASRIGLPAQFLLALVAGWLVFLWPTFVNGTAFFLADTTAYMRGADSTAIYLTGRTTEWSDQRVEVAGPARADVDRRRPAADVEPRVILAGRSVYYGAILYLVVRLVGFTGMAAVQAAMAACCVALAIARLARVAGAPVRPSALALCLVALGLVTPIGYYSAYMMPDLLAGLGGLALAMLLAVSAQMKRGEVMFWWLVLVAALISHSANLLIFGSVVAVAGVVGLVRRRPAWRATVLILSAMVIGLSSELLFSAGVEAITGAPPVRPPFLAARLIDDGAGRAYLRERCGRSTLLFCRERDRLPEGSDMILWSERPTDFSFASATPAQKRELAAEQSGLVLAIVRDRPVAVARGTVRSILAQLDRWSLVEFNYSLSDEAWLERKVPARSLAALKGSAAWSDRMPVRVVELTSRLAAAAAIMALIASLVVAWPARFAPLRTFALLTALVILCDVVVTGAMSTPHDRYLMRMIWLLPLGMLVLVRPLAAMIRARLSPGRFPQPQ